VGTVKFTCEMPATPGGVPANVTTALTPPMVTVTGSLVRGRREVAVPTAGPEPVIRNVVVSPSPVM
jgi:hypothetical protein